MTELHLIDGKGLLGIEITQLHEDKIDQKTPLIFDKYEELILKDDIIKEFEEYYNLNHHNVIMDDKFEKLNTKSKILDKALENLFTEYSELQNKFKEELKDKNSFDKLLYDYKLINSYKVILTDINSKIKKY
jgi:hypothetical protein